jgi:hypothetical protein
MSSKSLADKVVLLYVFMPIIRAELQTLVDTHNAHPIRTQRNRAHHVAGVARNSNSIENSRNVRPSYVA